MKHLLALAVTLLMALGTYAPTLANNNAVLGGAVIIVNGKEVVFSLDYKDCANGKVDTNGAEKQVVLLDSKGNVILERSFKGDVLTLSTTKMSQTPALMILSVGNCSKELSL